jgi:hypothetical protein
MSTGNVNFINNTLLQCKFAAPPGTLQFFNRLISAVTSANNRNLEYLRTLRYESVDSEEKKEIENMWREDHLLSTLQNETDRRYRENRLLLDFRFYTLKDVITREILESGHVERRMEAGDTCKRFYVQRVDSATGNITYHRLNEEINENLERMDTILNLETEIIKAEDRVLPTLRLIRDLLNHGIVINAVGDPEDPLEQLLA